METGKTVALYTYIHIEALESLAPMWRDTVVQASSLAKAEIGRDFNAVKLGQDGTSVSLLDYPGFFNEASPVLRRYWTVDLAKSTVRFRSYADSLNPPLLHRKELLLPKGHPAIEPFTNLTSTAEQIGLFDDPRRIGFLRAWEALLALRGYRVIGHELVPLGNDEATPVTENGSFAGVARHLTALSRTNLSAPVQTLARFGWLDRLKTVFDYGCGRGGDVRGLAENGITVSGWDPYYAPDEPKHPAHIVNLGFVINVIEDPMERLEALQSAYGLAEELLVVSAMLANPESICGVPYGDGVLTSRNTFQKYYTHAELRGWLAETLDAEPIPVAPGIFYVFNPERKTPKPYSNRPTCPVWTICGFISPNSNSANAPPTDIWRLGCNATSKSSSATTGKPWKKVRHCCSRQVARKPLPKAAAWHPNRAWVGWKTAHHYNCTPA